VYEKLIELPINRILLTSFHNITSCPANCQIQRLVLTGSPDPIQKCG